MALFTGIALRSLYQEQGAKKLAAIAKTCESIRAVPGVFLHWLIRIIPLAVMTVVAGAVSEYGYGIFATLFRYVGAVIAGFALQGDFRLRSLDFCHRTDEAFAFF
jgi:Na+/H+-dicarboxylate symporter